MFYFCLIRVIECACAHTCASLVALEAFFLFASYLEFRAADAGAGHSACKTATRKAIVSHVQTYGDFRFFCAIRSGRRIFRTTMCEWTAVCFVITMRSGDVHKVLRPQSPHDENFPYKSLSHQSRAPITAFPWKEINVNSCSSN